MSNTPLDFHLQLAEEFNVEPAFVRVIAREVYYDMSFASGANPDVPYEERVRAKVKHALELIDRSETK